MAYTDSTHQYQRMLADYVRTGVKTKIPNIKEEGIDRYRKMIYHVVDDSLATAYPLTKQLLTEEEWNSAVHNFLSSHTCQSPFLWKMPFEFFEFVKKTETALQNKYPYLNDLLLYEWVEIEVFMMDDIETIYATNGSVITDALVLNPSCILQYFQYPVYNKSVTDITANDLAHHFLLTHRNPETHLVRFLEVAPMFAYMIELLNEKEHTIEELIEHFSHKSGVRITPEIKEDIEAFFQKCLVQKIILGFKN